LGEVFLQAFVALAIHLVTDSLPYLHKWPSKIERTYHIAKAIQVRFAEGGGVRTGTYAKTNPIAKIAKYNGLSQPNATNAPYIQYGGRAMPDTVLLLAST
jgi:hypothetical protein